MSELRERMVQDLKLAGLVDATCEAYLRAARQLAKYHMTSPDQLSEIQVEQYILYVRDELGIAKGTFAPMFAGLKFLYVRTLGYEWPLFLKKESACHARNDCPMSAVMQTAAA